jgi:hypothetical protein
MVIHNFGKRICKWFFQTMLSIFETDNPGKHIENSNLDIYF